MLNVTALNDLTTWVADVLETDGGDLVSLHIAELADGSGRHYALVDTTTAGLDQQYRITAPAAFDAPAWTRGHDTWLVEVRVGNDKWLALEGVA